MDKSFLVQALPWMEQQSFYDSLNQDTSIFSRENRTSHTIVVGLFACPSDPDSGRPRSAYLGEMIATGLANQGDSLDMVFTSYTGSFGSFYVNAIPRPSNMCNVSGPLLEQANGTITDAGSTHIGDIRDGLSNTLFVVERATTDFRSFDPIYPDLFGRIGWWQEGNLKATLVTTFFPPNMTTRVSAGAGLSHGSAASSLHPGGLNALFGDGSVRFIKDTIDTWPYEPISGAPRGAVRTPGGWWTNLPEPGVWQKLASRAGGDIANAGDY